MALVLASLLPGVAADAESDDGGGGQPDQGSSATEVISARTEFSKTFATSEAGVYRTEIYAGPVHYADATSGEMVEIDTSLVDADGGRLETAATPVQVAVAPDPDAERLVEVTDRDSGASVSFGLVDTGAPTEVVVADHSVAVDDLAPGVDAELRMRPDGVKEEIILRAPGSARSLRYRLDAEGLAPSLEPDGSVVFRASGLGAATFVIPRGFMVDAADEMTSGVTYSLAEDPAGGWFLDLALDDLWLDDPARAWPVVVDPIIGQLDAEDTTITHNESQNQSTAPTIRAGFDGSEENRALTFVTGDIYYEDEQRTIFNPIGTEPETMWAGFKLESQDCSADPGDFELQALDDTTSWDPETVVWETAPALAGRIDTGDTDVGLETTTCTSDRIQWGYDISDYVQALVEGTEPYNGIALVAKDELNTAAVDFTAYDSADPTNTGGVIQWFYRDAAAEGQPDAPTSLTPAGPINTVTPDLAAIYRHSDPAEDGYVLYLIRDDAGTAIAARMNGGTAVDPGQVSSYNLESGILDWDRTYTLEAWSVTAINGPGAGAWDDLFNEVSNASLKTTATFTPSTAPYTPTDVEPAGITGDKSPALSAVYEDRNGENGHVEFEVYDTSTGSLVTTLTGDTVASGSRSSAQVPDGTLAFDGSYRIEAVAVDASTRSSESVQVFSGVQSPSGPVYNDDFPDPEVISYQGAFVAFGTNVGDGFGGVINVPVIESANLQNWGSLDDAMPPANMGDWADATPGLFQTWAPAVDRFSGTWVLYYSAWHATLGYHCIGSATSSSLTGEYIDGDGQASGQAESPLVCPGGDTIDASTFTDPATGKSYLLWKTDDTPTGDALLQAQELDSTGQAFASGSSPVTLLSGTETWELDYLEQPEMVYRNGQYWLFYAGNSWDTENYAIGYATCSAGPTAACAKVTDDSVGPWFASSDSVHSPRMFETANAWGPGAASFVADSVGATWMGYHGWSDGSKIGYPNGGVRALYVDRSLFSAATPTLSVGPAAGESGLIDIDPSDALGGGNSAGWSINNNGEIAGTAFTGGGTPEAVWWDETLVLDNLGPLSSEPEAQARGINDSAAIAGWVSDGPIASDEAVRFSPVAQWCVLPCGGPISYLSGLAAGGRSRAIDTNNNAETVGAALDIGEPATTPTRWSASGEVERVFYPGGFAAGDFGEATATNNASMTAGYVCPDSLCTSMTGFVDLAGLLSVEIPNDFGGSWLIPRDINDAGKVIGAAEASDGSVHAFLWDSWAGGALTDLGTNLPGDAEAYGINEHGQVVGTYTDSSGNAQGFLWQDGGIVVSGALFGDLGGGETKAYGINDEGHVTGTSKTAGGEWHAFLRPATDPTEGFGGAGPSTAVVDSAGLTNTAFLSLDLAEAPNAPHYNHQICLDITVDTGAGVFGFVGVDLELFDSSGVFYSDSLILTPNTDNHPIPAPASFNTDDHWPVGVRITEEVGDVRSWDVYPHTC